MSRALPLLFAFVLAACAAPGPAPDAGPAPAEPLDVTRDYLSYANTREFRTEHLVLDLAVDFGRRVLEGTAELRLARLAPQAAELVLDTRDLDVAAVEAAAGEGPWTPVAFRFDARDAQLGSALRIAFAPPADRVRIRYATRPDASGLQWVAPEQTAGKRQPFLYTQSQAIHARSWIPLQDTPQVRATYEARIRTPKALLAVMSAKNRPEQKRDGDYRFRMPQPVPSYLLALAVGDLKFRPIGPRTGVYAERPLLHAAALEFEDTEAMMEACTRLYGPYRWERYDLLILPPSFPYGGMENPRLTFLTPTAIAGDKSGVALIAHELAHSWSGNLVTNATWRDFWLNEGVTTYLTYRVMDEVFGAERGDMERVLGFQDLQRGLALAERPGDRALAVDVRGRTPDDIATYGTVPYQRGRLFLTYLESKFGRERFDAFLRAWFDRNLFQSRTTEDFVAFLEAELLSKQPGVVSMAKVREWIHGTELPEDAVLARAVAFERVDAQRQAWLDGRLALKDLKVSAWGVLEWRHFLDRMPPLTKEQVAALDRRFRLTQAKDPFVARDWFRLALAHDYRPAWPAVEQFLVRIGRGRLINPLYRELVKTPDGRAFAAAVYEKARAGYHPIARAGVERILAPPPVHPE